ncbi:MAG: nuclear transport factor 2 family protein [Halieaceae bacterium]|nr:nuclear transport factor 2 family protein [Halieaceae bacterium]MBT6263992.1 nuclear transport factor 2 family protein [Halieaceae bacterium]MBT7339686.1 nuclear transport factor 2 family protein [Halieaceae bacterium]
MSDFLISEDNLDMTDDEKLAIVNRLYERSAVGDFDTCETLLTDDFFIVEADDTPMAGTFTGITALRDLYAQVFGMLEVTNVVRTEITSGGDYVVTILHFEFADGLEPAHLCEMFRFRDGKVCEIRPYYFDAAPLRAAHEAFKAKQSR